MKILTIGGATQDIFITYEDAETLHLHTKKGKESFLLLKEGGKVEVKDLLYSSGGGANNTAFSFKKMEFDVSTFIKIGDDPSGNFILKKLHEADISTELVIVEHAGRTGISFIIPSLERDRTILAYRGINASIKNEEIPFSKLSSYDYLYITSLSGESSKLLLPITQHAKEHNIPVATNPGTSQLVAGAQILRESLPNIDILILNSTEAQMFMLSLAQNNSLLKETAKNKGRRLSAQQKPLLLEEPIGIEDGWTNLESFFQVVLSYGTKIVVVTNGAEGVYVATKDYMYFHPSLPIKVTNTLGAGDAFGSSFTGSIATGKSIEESIRNGIINAASVIGFMDTKQGLLSLQALEQRSKEIDPNLLQRYSFKL